MFGDVPFERQHLRTPGARAIFAVPITRRERSYSNGTHKKSPPEHHFENREADIVAAVGWRMGIARAGAPVIKIFEGKLEANESGKRNSRSALCCYPQSASG